MKEQPKLLRAGCSPSSPHYQGLCCLARQASWLGWAFSPLDPLAHPHVLCINHGEDLTNLDDVLGLVLGAGSTFPGGADLQPPIAPGTVHPRMGRAWLKLEQKTRPYAVPERLGVDVLFSCPFWSWASLKSHKAYALTTLTTSPEGDLISPIASIPPVCSISLFF